MSELAPREEKPKLPTSVEYDHIPSDQLINQAYAEKAEFDRSHPAKTSREQETERTNSHEIHEGTTILSGIKSVLGVERASRAQKQEAKDSTKLRKKAVKRGLKLDKNTRRYVTNNDRRAVYGSDDDEFAVTDIPKTRMRRGYEYNEFMIRRTTEKMQKKAEKAQDKAEKRYNKRNKSQNVDPVDTNDINETTEIKPVNVVTEQRVKDISERTLDWIVNDSPEDFFVDIQSPHESDVPQSEVAPESSNNTTSHSEETTETESSKVNLEPEQLSQSAKESVTIETASTAVEPEERKLSTEIPTEELIGIKAKISAVTAEMIEYVRDDARTKSGESNLQLSQDKIKEIIKDSRDYILNKEVVARFDINEADDTLKAATLEGIKILSDEIIDLTVSKAAELYSAVESKIQEAVKADKSSRRIGDKWRTIRSTLWKDTIHELPIEDRDITLQTFRELKHTADAERRAKNDARKAQIAEREAQKSAQKSPQSSAPAQSYEELLKTVPNA